MNKFMQGPYTPEPKRRRIKACDNCHHRYSMKNLRLEPIQKKHYCKACVLQLEIAKKKRWNSGSMIACQK